jgi:AcrR family transcriptional regulator
VRDQIKQKSTEMLIRYGYRGLRFQQIADALGITRSNIHYHFGSKHALAEEVVLDYTTVTLTMFEAVWDAPDTSFQTKITQTKDLNLRRYLAFNPEGVSGNPWSLIARMRAEREVLSQRSRTALTDFGKGLERCMTRGVRMAIERGELRADAPVADIVLQLVSIANSAGPITQDADGFERLEHLYMAVARIVQHAYGAPGLAPEAMTGLEVSPANRSKAARAQQRRGKQAARSN